MIITRHIFPWALINYNFDRGNNNFKLQWCNQCYMKGDFRFFFCLSSNLNDMIQNPTNVYATHKQNQASQIVCNKQTNERRINFHKVLHTSFSCHFAYQENELKLRKTWAIFLHDWDSMNLVTKQFRCMIFW